MTEWPSSAKNGPLSPKKLVWQEKEGHFLQESGPLLILTYQLKRKVGPLFGKMTPLLISQDFGPKMWDHFRWKVGSHFASGITIPFFQPSNILSLVLSV